MERTGILAVEREYMLTTAAAGISSDSDYTSRSLNPAEIDSFWPWLEPLVQSALERGHGEMTSDDVRSLLIAGLAFGFVAFRSGEVEMLAVVEEVLYPRLRAVRIMILAGKNLKDAARFLPALEDWALTIGATAIEGWTSEAHYRLYRRRKLGFVPVYWLLRKNLRGRLQ